MSCSRSAVRSLPGFGISVQSTDCGRSNRNYPNLIAQRYGLTLTDVTCGAATIPNVVDTAQGAHPPQLNAVTPDTKLITVSVGGNDIGYNATAVACGDPQSVCAAPATLASNLAGTRAALKAMLERIQVAAHRRPSCSSRIHKKVARTAMSRRCRSRRKRPRW